MDGKTYKSKIVKYFMFVKLKREEQEKIIRKAISKAGSYRALSKLVNIPRSTLTTYVRGNIINLERFIILTDFIKLRRRDCLILETLPNNWGQVSGGVECVRSKKRKGIFNKEMKKWQKHQSEKLKRWHSKMKKENPEEYYKIQYSRFKKVGEYKFITKKGEKVRNILEKNAADILFDLGIEYKYEPLIHIGPKYFFPDFLINENIVLECTMWRGFQKAYKLKEKIEILKKKYKIFVLIPKPLYSYYEILDNHLINGLDEFVPVAQTFPKSKV